MATIFMMTGEAAWRALPDWEEMEDIQSVYIPEEDYNFDVRMLMEVLWEDGLLPLRDEPVVDHKIYRITLDADFIALVVLNSNKSINIELYKTIDEV